MPPIAELNVWLQKDHRDRAIDLRERIRFLELDDIHFGAREYADHGRSVNFYNKQHLLRWFVVRVVRDESAGDLNALGTREKDFAE